MRINLKNEKGLIEVPMWKLRQQARDGFGKHCAYRPSEKQFNIILMSMPRKKVRAKLPFIKNSTHADQKIADCKTIVDLAIANQPGYFPPSTFRDNLARTVSPAPKGVLNYVDDAADAQES